MTSVGIESDGPLATEVKAALGRKALYPSSEWLQAFLQTQRSTTPVSAIASTASFRILAGDITTILSKAGDERLPSDIHDSNLKERSLPSSPIVVQILDIEDLGRSRWEQIEAIEAIERGEGTKGYQIIRVGVTHEDEEDAAGSTGPSNASSELSQRSKGPHKVLFQDATGSTAFGIELRRIDGLDLSMSMGSKLVLNGCAVARGVVLLEPTTVSLLGGKIESLHRVWTAEKKKRLRAAIESQPGT